MPPLRRPRQELFVQHLLRGAKHGVTQREAYVAAGYKSHGESIDFNASRLRSSEKVKARMDELTRPAIRKTRVSVQSLLEELDTTVKDARAAKQHSTVVSALALMAKLVGLLRNELVIGSPQEFAALETPEQVIAQVREELGDDAALALTTLVEAQRAAKAVDVTPQAAPSLPWKKQPADNPNDK